jgi:hypothetical protein
MGSVISSVVGIVADVLGMGGGQAASPQGSKSASEKQAYGGEFAEDKNQAGYQAKAGKAAPGGASNETLLTGNENLGDGTLDNGAPTTSDLGGTENATAGEKQAEAGKRRDEIANKLYGK